MLLENQDSNMKDDGIKKSNKNFTIFNIILIIVIFIGLAIYMISVDGIDNIIYLLQNVNYFWVIGGLLCLFGVWLCESITLHIPLKQMYPDNRFSTSIKVSMIGQLFNNITPFSSGGQPMQAYELTKTGKRVSDSLSALAMKFIITQIALITFTIGVVIFKFDFFINIFKDFLWVVILGFAINIIAIIFVILMGINENIVIKIASPFIKLLGKFHIGKWRIFKDVDNTLLKFKDSVKNFHNQFLEMKAHKKMVLKIFIISFIQSLLYYSITYMVYRAFGNSGTSFFEIITVQSFLLLIMTFIPTPGSGLGAEGGFLLLFNSIFINGTINMSILFWRIYTFYLPIIVGALFLIPTSYKKKSNNKV